MCTNELEVFPFISHKLYPTENDNLSFPEPFKRN